MSSEWTCVLRERSYKTKQFLPHAEVCDHPLKLGHGFLVTESRNVKKIGSFSKTSSSASSTLSVDPLGLDGSDPLTHYAETDSIDPLSKMAVENEAKRMDISPDEHVQNQVNNLWKNRRAGILRNFTTAEKLTISTSFLSDGEMVRPQTRISEKVKSRLEQLDDFEHDSVHKMINLTQQEYQVRIDQLKYELIQAWNTDQRVRALKIAIQCSQLLADTSVLQFYPSQFVLITDILETFGNLVYERLWIKAESESVNRKLSPTNFTAEMIPESVQETCKNWFYKIASIRELLPRLYLEIALLKSYQFLMNTNINTILCRLTRTIRGIGDPLIAIYTRCFLCRVGITVTFDLEYILENLNDFLFVYNTIVFGGIRANLTSQRIDIDGYIQLYTPALNFIMEVISTQASDSLLDDIFSKCQVKKNNGLLLQCILTTFKPSFIAARASKLMSILTVNHGGEFNNLKSQLLRLLGVSVCRHSPDAEQRLAVLNGTWKSINTITHLNEYISCIEPWAEYITLHFGVREINILLGDILLRLNQARSYENLYMEIELLLNKIINHCDNLEALIISENFLPVLDAIQKESIRVEICKNILNAYKTKTLSVNETFECSDAVIINALKYVCKILSDGISSVSVEDEKRHASQLIAHFIRLVTCGDDFERQLLFYVEARATFSNFDSVLEALVHCVNLLAVNARRITNGHHTKKTSAFVKACSAYCFITIPSIVSITSRLNLYLLSGEVALLNGCLGQADSFFEAIINLLNELPILTEIDGKVNTNEAFVIQFILNFLSTLIIVPDSPEQGVLYLPRCLLDFIKNYKFHAENHNKIVLYLQILDMLTVAVRETYPYHVSNLVSNDELYGSDPKFIAEINVLCTQVVDLILLHLKHLGENNQLVEQCTLSLELFERIVFNSNISKDKMFPLSINLWNLAMKNAKLFDKKLPGMILLKVERYKRTIINDELRNALEELTIRMKNKM